MVSVSATGATWREAKRAAARQAIVDAARVLVREEGFGGLSIRDLAHRAGITTPTLYAYFGSKDAIFDAMFAQGHRELAERRKGRAPKEPREALRWVAEEFVAFCIEDPVRYQLLFQRPVPGFVPSESSFELARQNLEQTREHLVAVGLTEPEHLDVWTAVWAGVVAQQTANDPGGDRWTRHFGAVLEMYLSHYLQRSSRRRRPS